MKISRWALLGLSCAFAVAACSSSPEEGAGQSSQDLLVPVQPIRLSSSWVDGNVESFKAIDATTVYVLGTNGNLWNETGTMATRTLVDWNVRAFQPLPDGMVYVLDNYGTLWRERGSYAYKSVVDTNVASFSAYDDGSTVLVKSTNDELWSETGTSANRVPVASNVNTVQAVAADVFFYTDLSGGLWRSQVPVVGAGQIDSSVLAFQASSNSALEVLVLGSNRLLWDEFNTAQNRVLIDGSVESFAYGTNDDFYVLGTNGNLWREFVNASIRSLVSASTAAFQPVAGVVYVQDTGGNLWRDVPAAPRCEGTSAPPPGGCFGGFAAGYEYAAAYGTATTAGWCPSIYTSTGTWAEITSSGVPGASLPNGPPTCTSAMSGPCCTYVWWPSASNPTAPQDPTAFCSAGLTEIVGLLQCGEAMPTGIETLVPGGGGCPVCGKYGGG